MFGINIRIEDGLYRRSGMVSEIKTPQCTVQVIEQQGFSFEQALKLISPLKSRRELQAKFEVNGYRISEEEIRDIAAINNIVI